MKKKIIFLSIFIFTLLAGGVGIYFYTQTHRAPITWAEEAKYKTYTEPAPTDGSMPTDYDSYMNIAYVLWTLEHTENFSSTTRGTAVSVGQTQEILNRRIVNKDMQVVETYSGGLITLGKQKYFINNRVLLRDYASKNGETFTWKTDEPECITEEAYKKRYGWFPTQSTAYIICNETILEISDITVLEDGLFSIKLSLNPGEFYAPFWYAREVSTNASSLSKPAFSSIEVEYIFDANWRVHKVNTKEKYKVTPKVAPLTVDCVTNIEEIFNYDTYKIDDTTIQFFDQYKDKQPAGGEIVEEPETPLSYITGALLGSTGEQKFNLSISLNGNQLQGQIALDLSNLNQIGLKVRFGNFQIVYQNDTAYIDLGSNKVKLNKNEFMELLAPMLNLTSTDKTQDESSLFDVNQIMSDIASSKITKEENKVTIDTTLQLVGIKVPLQFVILEEDQKMSLISISTSIAYQDLHMDLLLTANPTASFMDVEGEYNDAKNIKFILDDLFQIILNKRVGVQCSILWNGMEIKIDAIIDWQTQFAVQAKCNVKSNTMDESFTLTYVNDIVYLDFYNIKVKMTVEEIKEMIQSNISLPSVDNSNIQINDILSCLASISFDQILKSLTITENEITVQLDLSTILQGTKEIDLIIKDTENGFTFQNESYGIFAAVKTDVNEKIEVTETEYSNLTNYSKVIEYLTKIINKESIRMNISGKILPYEIGIEGQMDFILKDGTYEIEGQLKVSYQTKEIEIGIVAIKDAIYISVLGQTIQVNPNHITEILETICTSLGIKLPKVEEKLNLKEILESIQIKEEEIRLDLSSIGLGIVTLGMEMGGKLNGNLQSEIFQMGIEVTTIEGREISHPEATITETEIYELIEYIKEIQKIQKNGYVVIEIDGTYAGVKGKGEIQIDFRNGIKVKANLTVEYKEEQLRVEIHYINELLYIECKNIKVKTSLEELKSILPINLPIPNGKEIEIDQILEIIKGLKIEESGIEILMNLESIKEGLGEIIVNVVRNANGIEITTNPYEFKLNVDTNKEPVIEVTETEYSNLTNYSKVIEYLTKIINKESIRMNISGKILPYEIGIEGQMDFILKDGTYEIEGQLKVSYQTKEIEIGIVAIKDAIYISVLGQTIQVNPNHITEILETICTSLGIKLPKVEEKLNLKEILESIQIKEEEIRLDLSSIGLGIVTLGMEMGGKLNGNLQSEIFQMGIEVTTIEGREISHPEATITETEIYELIEYIKEIQKIQKNGYVVIEIDGTYAGVKGKGEIQIDFRNGIKVKANLTVEYKEEQLRVEIHYINELLYIECKNIKVKTSLEELKSILPINLPIPNGKEIEIDQILEIIKGLKIEESGIEILMNLESIKEGLGEIIVNVVRNANGIEITTNPYEFIMDVDTNKEPVIEVTETEYSNLTNYSKVIEYLTKIINKESIRMNLDGSYKDILWNGTIDFVYQTETKQYDILANLILKIQDIQVEFEIRVVNQKIFIQFYDNVICIPQKEIMGLINDVFAKLGLPLINFDFTLSLSDILPILDIVSVKENGIVLNLNSILSSLSVVMIDFILYNNGMEIIVNETNLKCNVVLGSSNVTEVQELLPTIEYNDFVLLLDQIGYLIQLYKGQAIHIEIGSTKVEIQEKKKKEEIQFSGAFDLLLNKSSFIMQGNLTFTGFGIDLDMQFVLTKDKVYVTISNQTIMLLWSELDSLIYEAKQILQPILKNNPLTLPKFDLKGFDIGDLNFKIDAEGIALTLDNIVGKICSIGVGLTLIQDNQDIKGMNLIVNGVYDSIRLQMPITLSASALTKIEEPTENLITKTELLQLLEYGVELYTLAQQKEFNLEIQTTLSKNGNAVAQIEGMLSLKILENNEFDARAKVIIREYQNGNAVAWHQLDINIISLTTMNTLDSSIQTPMVYITYGNNESDLNAVIKVSSTYKGITDLIESIMNLMNIEIPVLQSGQTNCICLSHILNSIDISNTKLSLGINLKDLFAAMQDEDQVLQLEIMRNEEGKIIELNASNIYLSYTNALQFMTMDQVTISLKEEGLSVELPSEKESYYDISNISNLFEALYYNALEKNFEITGTVTLTALSIVNVNVPITIKVNVDEKGAPTIYAHLDMGNLGLGAMMMSKKQIYIYYKDEYVYIHRDDSKDKDDRKLKIHYTEFFNNLVYYLMDYAMGLPESIISLINKTPEGDGFIDASQCVNSISIGTDLFEFNLNLKEIVDNNDLGDLEITLGATNVAKTDEQGNYIYDEAGNLIYVPMIYNIPKFKFVCVNVINLNSNSLVLSNIQKDENGNLVVQDVSMNELDQYIYEFDSQFNADEEYIYTNGAWVSNGRLKHIVSFDMGLAGSKIIKLSEGEKINFPYATGEILSVPQEEGMRYYKIMGWYYDASYLKPILDIQSHLMANKGLVYYAKVKDVTIQLEITSDYDEPQILTVYEGYDLLSHVEELYSIKNINNVIYKFNGVNDASGQKVDLNSLAPGTYAFVVDWVEVQYDFYALYGKEEYRLEQTDTMPFLDQDYGVEKNQNYFIYLASKLTPNFILQNFASTFVLNEERQRFEIQLFAVNDVKFEQYHKITFETAREEFNNKGYYGFFIRKDRNTDITSYLPNGSYDSYEINAWVSNRGTYYSFDDLKQINDSYEFSSYISTKQSYFEFEVTNDMACISLYTGTASTVIFPEFAYVGSRWVPIGAIKEQTESQDSPFTANTSIENLVFNESLASIPANAFKNCDGLVNIYLPASLQASAVAVDAFYFVKEGALNFEKARDQAKELRFHCSDAQANAFNLVACKYNGSDRHYGKNEAGFLGAGRADLRDSFVKEKVDILNISTNLIKNL